jgi:N-carbamoyl-L-amino-acid hydrolase
MNQPTDVSSVEPDIDLARSLFAELETTREGRGFTPATYGQGEDFAHAAAGRAARRLGLEIENDAAKNLDMTLPGRNRNLPRIMTGSHMDSVPQGGNFDGVAGVISGLAAVAGLKVRGIMPPRDVTVMAIRGEEAVWFDWSYIGSHAAFGRLTAEALAVRRSDTGRTLADHMADAGCDVAALRRARRIFRRIASRPSWTAISSKVRCWSSTDCRWASSPAFAAACATPRRDVSAPTPIPARRRASSGAMRWRPLSS